MLPPKLEVTDPCFIPKDRYTSREFFEMERELLWPHAWQMACREEELPAVGDFTEYEICDESILLVRTSPDEVKGFFNACRHRATQLVSGEGRFRGGRIVCPFHGWSWDLDGSVKAVVGEQGFDQRCLEDADTKLRECQVTTWGGCVFVNMDPAARPLHQAFAPVAELIDPLDVGTMRVRWWKATVLEANWKLAQEAFMEALHVAQTHPQLTVGVPEGTDPEAQEYFVHRNGHSHFENRPTGKSTPEMVVESSRLLCEGLDAMTLPRDLHVIEGLLNRERSGSFGRSVVEAIYEHAEGAGIPMPPADPAVIQKWGGMFFVFPNYFVLPQYGNALAYRSRPNGLDPESCLFELWSLTIFPAGQEPEDRPEMQGPFDPADDTVWPLIPLQDFSNIERQQRGLHSRSVDHLRLSSRYEGGIANMHQELDRYLAR